MIQKDLLTAIGTAIIGAVIAYFLCNSLLVPMIATVEEQKVKQIDSNFSLDIATPSPEVFNYRAINPTVEVYVGDCNEFNDYGECIDNADSNPGQENR